MIVVWLWNMYRRMGCETRWEDTVDAGMVFDESMDFGWWDGSGASGGDGSGSIGSDIFFSKMVRASP